MRGGRFLLASLLFVGSVWAANWLTQTYGQAELLGLVFTWGTLAAGASLVARDAVFETGGRWPVLALITVGGALSALLDPMLALASAVAFVGSELADSAVYEPARARLGRARAVALSGLVAAPIDTALFFWLAPAFIESPPEAWAGQLIVKGGISVAAALWLQGWRRR